MCNFLRGKKKATDKESKKKKIRQSKKVIHTPNYFPMRVTIFISQNGEKKERERG